MESQLKAIRRAQGLAIWGLSVMSGVSPSLLTAIERWCYVPSASTQKRIADALGVQVEDIWTKEDAHPASSLRQLRTGTTAADRSQENRAEQSDAEGEHFVVKGYLEAVLCLGFSGAFHIRNQQVQGAIYSALQPEDIYIPPEPPLTDGNVKAQLKQHSDFSGWQAARHLHQ